MKDCDHLDSAPRQVSGPGLVSEPISLCLLKITMPTRARMAIEATNLLGELCLPNSNCHYHHLDLCEQCRSYKPRTTIT